MRRRFRDHVDRVPARSWGSEVNRKLTSRRPSEEYFDRFVVAVRRDRLAQEGA